LMASKSTSCRCDRSTIRAGLQRLHPTKAPVKTPYLGMCRFMIIYSY
jgi:hypothetical protein